MKPIIFILTMLICTTTHGQVGKLMGTWISSSNDVMFINDTLTKYDNNMLCTSSIDVGTAFNLNGDTLSFQRLYYTLKKNDDKFKLYVDIYDCIAISRTDSTITVKPSSILSKELFSNREMITFTKQEFNIDNSIVFEKIIYHFTDDGSYATPTIHLEIDNKRNIYLEGKFYKGHSLVKFNIDSTKSGRFIGKLNDSLFNELQMILKTSNLKKLIFPDINGNDASVTTLIIFFNGQRKYLKSMFPPAIANKLIKFLFSINEKIALTRTDEKRKLQE